MELKLGRFNGPLLETLPVRVECSAAEFRVGEAGILQGVATFFDCDGGGEGSDVFRVNLVLGVDEAGDWIWTGWDGGLGARDYEFADEVGCGKGCFEDCEGGGYVSLG